MMGKKIRLGFLGCGWIVEHAHIPSFSKLENIEIISVFDIEILRAKRLSDMFNIKNYCDDIDHFFDSGIDAVVIATPNYTHADYSLRALRRGLHVLCEKPVALFTSEIEEIIYTANANNVVYMPGFVNRFRNEIMKLKNIILSGEIGEIRSIEAGWLRKNGIPRLGTWFTCKEYSGGGVLVDLGPHIIDICLMFSGSQRPQEFTLFTSIPENVSTLNSAKWFEGSSTDQYMVNVEDTAYAEVKYDDDKSINLNLSWNAPIDGDATYFNITGTKKSLKLKTLFGFSNNRLWEKDSLVKIEKDLELVESFESSTNNTRNAFDSMAGYFVRTIEGQNDNYLRAEDALNTVSLIEQLYLHENKSPAKIRSVSLEEAICE